MDKHKKEKGLPGSEEAKRDEAIRELRTLTQKLLEEGRTRRADKNRAKLKKNT